MPKHVVFISPALEGGGIESSIPQLISRLTDVNGLWFHWIGLNASTSPTDLKNVEIVSMTRKSGAGLWATWRTFRQLIKVLKNIPDPIVVVNGELAELFSIPLLMKYRLIFVEHASKPWKKMRILGWLVRRIINLFSPTWISVNASQKRIWPSVSSFHFIPNPVNLLSTFSPDNTKGIVIIGRLNQDKEIELICLAVKKANIQLDIYGDGPLRQLLSQKYGGEPTIRFHGFIDNPWRKIGPHKLFISNSRHEGDGKAVAEAIVRSQPLLIRDTVDHRRFGLSEVNYFEGLEDLESKIVDYSESPLDRFVAPISAIEFERKNRDPDRIAAAWLTVILS